MIRKFISVVGFSLFLFCNSGDAPSDCTPISNSIELLYPKGGETFSYGQSFPIKWKVNPDSIDQVNIMLINSSAKRIYLLDKGIAVLGNICMDTVLTISDSANVPKGNYKLMVSMYNDATVCDSSDLFTIK